MTHIAPYIFWKMKSLCADYTGRDMDIMQMRSMFRQMDNLVQKFSLNLMQ